MRGAGTYVHIDVMRHKRRYEIIGCQKRGSPRVTHDSGVSLSARRPIKHLCELFTTRTVRTPMTGRSAEELTAALCSSESFLSPQYFRCWIRAAVRNSMNVDRALSVGDGFRAVGAPAAPASSTSRTGKNSTCDLQTLWNHAATQAYPHCGPQSQHGVAGDLCIL